MASLVVGVLAIHQSQLSRVNAELSDRARDLAAANRDLQIQIDQREKAEEALRQSQKMEAIGQLTGGVAHDFNNLLQVILGNLDRLRRRHRPGDGSPPAERDFQRHDRRRDPGGATRRATDPAHAGVLAPAAAGAEAGRCQPPGRAACRKCCSRTLGETIAVEPVLAGGLWRALADENQLENALLNLAVNARDAMPDGGKLTIEAANVALDEAYASAEQDVRAGPICHDRGQRHRHAACRPDVLAKVFEPFFTTKDIGQGTGLGLSLVFGFVKQSGGHVKIYSEPGEGTTVKLYLPRLLCRPRTPRAAAEAPPVPRRLRQRNDFGGRGRRPTCAASPSRPCANSAIACWKPRTGTSRCGCWNASRGAAAVHRCRVCPVD